MIVVVMYCDFGRIFISRGIALDDSFLPVCSDFQYLYSSVTSNEEVDPMVEHIINNG